MTDPASQLPIRAIDLRAGPAQVLRGWPRDCALAALWSSRPISAAEARWSRWSIFAAPVGPARGGTLEELQRLVTSTSRCARAAGDPDLPPFVGGWIAALNYELGAAIEPAAASVRAAAANPGGWPHISMMHCPGALVHDGLLDRWWLVGDAGAAPGLDTLTRIAEASPFSLRPVAETPADRRRYTDAVARTIEYIRAGDIFQANIARFIEAEFDGSARALWGALLDAAGPWYGAYMEWPEARRAVLSASPELFFETRSSTRVITTRPIKGTRPGTCDERELLESGKDRAELNMIIDLMRNDLGRIGEFGSVRVVEPVAVERHARADGGGGVLHGVATIRGQLREGVGVADTLRALFPAGSITGAPKVRAMQIIDELEPEPRGLYTGSIGYISNCGNTAFNVAIRTAVLDRGRLRFGVGAGIVADSDPAREWDETVTKASILAAAAERSTRTETVPA